MIAKKLLSLWNLIKIQVFYVYEAAKVVMIGEDKNFVLEIFWIMPPCFEGLNDGQKLTIISFLSSFG